MLLCCAVAVSLLLGLHGGTTTGGTSSGGTSSGTASSGGTSTGAATTGTSTTGAATTGGSTTGSSEATTTLADDTNDLEAGPPAEGDETPASSSDAGADPTFGPFDESSSAGFDDDDPVDGCCDHRENNSDNFLCRISSTRFDRLAITVLLLLLGRPRKRGRTAGRS